MNATHTGQPPRAAFLSARPRPRAGEVRLAARKTAKSSVWRLVHLRVQDWARLLDLLPDAERVAVELVERAVETTGIADDEPRWFEIEELSTIGVRVSTDHQGALLIQVRDSDSTSPYPPEGAYLDRHLTAAHELSYQWN